jgi:hypothetical protein
MNLVNRRIQILVALILFLGVSGRPSFAFSANFCSDLFPAINMGRIGKIVSRYWNDPAIYELYRRIRPNQVINIPKEPFSITGRVFESDNVMSVLITGIASSQNVYKFGRIFIVNQWASPKAYDPTLARALTGIIRGVYAHKQIRNPEITQLQLILPTVENKKLAEILAQYGFERSDRKMTNQEIGQLVVGPRDFFELTLDLNLLSPKIRELEDFPNTDFSFPETDNDH